jgi:PAS domain S-box-containing protein
MKVGEAKTAPISDDLQTRLAASESRIAELQSRLAEAEETLQAIRTGEVDALVVSGPDGDQIFALEGADHAYRILVEEMQEGTVTLDESGLILYANRQFGSMIRMPVENIVGSRIQRFVPVNRRAAFSALLAEVDHCRQRSELTLLTDDSVPVPVNLSLNRVQTGGINTICAVITDLTEQRHYEAMVKDGELSRSILDQAVESIVVIDARGKILRISESARKLAGRDVLLRHFDFAFPFSERDQKVDAQRLMSAARSNNGIRSLEVTLKHDGQPTSTLLLSAGPLWSSSRDLLGCVVTLTDISERKLSEEALGRQAHELERMNSDLKQFAYAVSHDLREPIRIVANYSQLLEKKYKDKLDEHADGYIKHTVNAAHRLEALMDDLLAYTQTAETQHKVEASLDANIVLAKTLNMLDTAITESAARIESDPLPTLWVEEVHLQQLFQNLIANSLKYRGHAPLRIHVTAQPGKDMWTLSVSDNGIGIDPQYHEHIFGLFKRLHGGNKYSGSGMGLAICQKIVERYKGRIWVESEPGRGAKFLFTLPKES